MYCYQCGTKLPDGSRFCPACGMRQPVQEANGVKADQTPVSACQDTRPVPPPADPTPAAAKNPVEQSAPAAPEQAAQTVQWQNPASQAAGAPVQPSAPVYTAVSQVQYTSGGDRRKKMLLIAAVAGILLLVLLVVAALATSALIKAYRPEKEVAFPHSAVAGTEQVPDESETRPPVPAGMKEVTFRNLTLPLPEGAEVSILTSPIASGYTAYKWDGGYIGISIITDFTPDIIFNSISSDYYTQQLMDKTQVKENCWYTKGYHANSKPGEVSYIGVIQDGTACIQLQWNVAETQENEQAVLNSLRGATAAETMPLKPGFKAYTFDYLTMNVPEGMKDISGQGELADYTFALENAEIAIVALREDFSDIPYDSRIGYQEYAQALIDVNGYNTTLQEEPEYYYYTTPVPNGNGGNNYIYTAAVNGRYGEYWMIQILQKTENIDRAKYIAKSILIR